MKTLYPITLGVLCLVLGAAYQVSPTSASPVTAAPASTPVVQPAGCSCGATCECDRLRDALELARNEIRTLKTQSASDSKAVDPNEKYVCAKCGWKPRDDGPMNNVDTLEPLVASMRIHNHEYEHALEVVDSMVSHQTQNLACPGGVCPVPTPRTVRQTSTYQAPRQLQRQPLRRGLFGGRLFSTGGRACRACG